MSKLDGSSRLRGDELMKALLGLPGWRSIRRTGRLLGEWRFRAAEDAVGFLLMMAVLAFDNELLPEVHWLRRSVTAVLSDPEQEGVTLRVLALARRLSSLGGEPGPVSIPSTSGAVARVVQALKSVAPAGFAALALQSARGDEHADPVERALEVLARSEKEVASWVREIEERRVALARFLPDAEAAERLCEAHSPLTLPMRLDRDLSLVAERLNEVLELLRAAQALSDTPQPAETLQPRPPVVAEDPVEALARLRSDEPTGRIADTLRRLEAMLKRTEDQIPVAEPKAARYRKRLESLPGWEAVQGGTALRGVLTFGSREMALDFLRLAEEVVEREGWRVDLSLEEPAQVRVVIRAEGVELTERDFDAAAALERLGGNREEP